MGARVLFRERCVSWRGVGLVSVTCDVGKVGEAGATFSSWHVRWRVLTGEGPWQGTSAYLRGVANGIYGGWRPACCAGRAGQVRGWGRNTNWGLKRRSGHRGLREYGAGVRGMGDRVKNKGRGQTRGRCAWGQGVGPGTCDANALCAHVRGGSLGHSPRWGTWYVCADASTVLGWRPGRVPPNTPTPTPTPGTLPLPATLRQPDALATADLQPRVPPTSHSCLPQSCTAPCSWHMPPPPSDLSFLCFSRNPRSLQELTCNSPPPFCSPQSCTAPCWWLRVTAWLHPWRPAWRCWQHWPQVGMRLGREGGEGGSTVHSGPQPPAAGGFVGWVLALLAALATGKGAGRGCIGLSLQIQEHSGVCVWACGPARDVGVGVKCGAAKVGLSGQWVEGRCEKAQRGDNVTIT